MFDEVSQTKGVKNVDDYLGLIASIYIKKSPSVRGLLISEEEPIEQRILNLRYLKGLCFIALITFNICHSFQGLPETL